MSSSTPHPSSFTQETAATKKKRRPAGTPDPDAEVVSLSPRTLLESDRYVCEICGQGFQRDQNLQMHRRRHKVPWKLLKREPGAAAAAAGETKKRVFVCPEPSCLHHDPAHALGDLVGIKKHYRRKHSDRRQWVCERCSKGYAVQSDYKAHLKTCGTRGHTCDCGRVFSRVESFIEHQDSCSADRSRLESHVPQTPTPTSHTQSSPTPSTDDTNFTSPTTTTTTTWSSFRRPSLELQLLSTSPSRAAAAAAASTTTAEEHCIAQLNLSLGLSSEDGRLQAEEARRQAKRQAELAEEEHANAKRMRREAQAELDKALVLREHAARSVNSVLLQITCQSCTLNMLPAADENPVPDPASAVTDGEPK